MKKMEQNIKTNKLSGDIIPNNNLMSKEKWRFLIIQGYSSSLKLSRSHEFHYRSWVGPSDQRKRNEWKGNRRSFMGLLSLGLYLMLFISLLKINGSRDNHLIEFHVQKRWCIRSSDINSLKDINLRSVDHLSTENLLNCKGHVLFRYLEVML